MFASEMSTAPKLMTGAAAAIWSLVLGVIAAMACEPIVHAQYVNEDVWGSGGPGGPFEPENLILAAFIGFVAAVIISPVHVSALRDRPRNRCLGIVYGSTLTVSLVAALIGGLACIPIAMVASAGSAIAATMIVPAVPSQRGVCRSCRYQVRDLEVCPECGAPKVAATSEVVGADPEGRHP